MYCTPCGEKHAQEARSRADAEQRANRYHITREEYDQLLSIQGGLCKSCGYEMRPPHLDHDHETGRIRGFLCNGCNTALGLLGEDPQRIEALLCYYQNTHPARDE